MTAQARRWAAIAILAGFVGALLLPAVRSNAADTALMPGWMVFVWGGLFWWMVPTLGWLANLALPTALFALRRRLWRWFGGLSLAMTALALWQACTWSTIPTTTDKVEHITAHYGGFYLWLVTILGCAAVIALRTRWRAQPTGTP